MIGPADQSNNDHGAGRGRFCTLTAAYGSAGRLWIGRFGLVGQVWHVRFAASADAAGIWATRVRSLFPRDTTGNSV